MRRIVLLAALALVAGCGPVNIVLPNGAVSVPSIAPMITLTTPSAPGSSDPNAPAQPPPPPTNWNLPGNSVDGGGGSLGGLR